MSVESALGQGTPPQGVGRGPNQPRTTGIETSRFSAMGKKEGTEEIRASLREGIKGKNWRSWIRCSQKGTRYARRKKISEL